MKVLVTGVYGFIGSNLAVKLKTAGHEVIGIDAISTSYEHPVHSDRRELIRSLDIQVIEKNLSGMNSDTFKSEMLKFSVSTNFDVVIHLAAWPGVLKSEAMPIEYFRNNVVAFANMLLLLRDIEPKKFLYASSSSVYGNLGIEGACKEDALLPLPLNYYAKTKRFDEDLALVFPGLNDLETCGLRFFTVVGPMGRPDMSYWQFADKVSKDLPVLLRGESGGFRDFTDIEDVTGILMRLIQDEIRLPKILNICNGKPKATKDMLSKIALHLGKEPILKVVERSSAEAETTLGSQEELTKTIGSWDWVPFETTIKSFTDWYQQTSYFNS